MTISYGGVNLDCADREILDYVQERLDPAAVRIFMRQSYPDPRLPTLPQSPDYHAEPIRLQQLFWPTGATRWAEGYFLCTDQQLTPITKAYYANNTVNPLPFVFGDGSRPLLTTTLYMLPPRPIQQCGSFQGTTIPGVYLLTLVDARYYWPDVAATISVTAGSTQWVSLFSALASALRINLSVDEVNAAYLTPTADFGVSYENLAIVLEAACRSVGQRLVANYDGTYATQNPLTAYNAVLANFGTQSPGFAGSRFRLQPGGQVSDLNAVAPSNVAMIFTTTSGGIPTGTSTEVVVNLATLQLAQYGSATGDGSTFRFHSAVLATESNSAAISALATQAATDWYLWRLGLVDQRLVGTGGWTPEAFHDIEWLTGDGVHDYCSIRVSRGPWNDLTDIGQIPAPTASLPCGLTMSDLNGTIIENVGQIVIGGNLVLGSEGSNECGNIATLDGSAGLVIYEICDPTLIVPLVPAGKFVVTNCVKNNTTITNVYYSVGGGEYVTLSCCGSVSGSGSGSGSGSKSGSAGGGTIQTLCCPNKIPATLWGHISSTLGSCYPCLNGLVIQFTNFGGFGGMTWNATSAAYPTGFLSPCTGQVVFAGLSCLPPPASIDGWIFGIGASAPSATVTFLPMFSTCGPPLVLVFEVSYPNPNSNNVCGTTGSFYITFTESP